MQRSYFGDIAVVKQVDPNIEDVFPAAVFEKDEFSYVMKHAVIIEITHTQKLENKDGPIKAAYATIIYKDGHEISTVMTIEQIKKAWMQSPIKPVNADGSLKADSTHGKFPEAMALRTIVRRACKTIIDSSDDSNLLVQYAKQSYSDSDEAEVEAEVRQNANSIPFDDEAIEVDPATGSVVGGGPVKASDPF